VDGSATKAERRLAASTSVSARVRRLRAGAAVAAVAGCLALSSPPAGAAPAQRDVSWTTQRVDYALAADDYSYSFTGIGVGPLGRAVMLYEKGLNQFGGWDMRVARGPLDGGSFHRVSVVPGQPRVYGGESLAVGPKGRAYVSFRKGVFDTQGTLEYAVRHPGGWTVETVDTQKSVEINELAMGAHHQPYIAYSKLVPLVGGGYGHELWMATKVDGSWQTQKVADGLVWALDIALNADGQPEIAYVYDTGLGVQNIAARIARFDGTSWSFQDIGPVVESGGIEFGIDLLIDASGQEDVAYPVFDPDPGIIYGHYDGAQWNTQLIAGGNLWQPSMAYDPSGGVHVTYYDADPGALRFASLVNGSWDVQTIADSASDHVRIGRQSSLAFDPEGRARVVYYVGREFKGTFVRYAESTTPVTAHSPHATFRTLRPSQGGWTTARPHGVRR
jgi:hypothetical protein